MASALRMSPGLHRLAYRGIRLTGAVVGVPYFRPSVEGAEHVRRDAPFIVACNHVTLLDWAALAYFIPRPVRFMMTRAYYDRPALRWFFRLGGAIPVSPGRIEPSALRRALATLRAGEAVGIFPEGRLGTERPLPAQRGVAALAMHARAEVVPATIRGASRAFPSSATLPRPFRVTVVFGPPLAPPPPGSSQREQGRFARHLMETIAGLQAPRSVLVGAA